MGGRGPERVENRKKKLSRRSRKVEVGRGGGGGSNRRERQRLDSVCLLECLRAPKAPDTRAQTISQSRLRRRMAHVILQSLDGRKSQRGTRSGRRDGQDCNQPHGVGCSQRHRFWFFFFFFLSDAFASRAGVLFFSSFLENQRNAFLPVLRPSFLASCKTDKCAGELRRCMGREARNEAGTRRRKKNETSWREEKKKKKKRYRRAIGHPAPRASSFLQVSVYSTAHEAIKVNDRGANEGLTCEQQRRKEGKRRLGTEEREEENICEFPAPTRHEEEPSPQKIKSNSFALLSRASFPARSPHFLSLLIIQWRASLLQPQQRPRSCCSARPRCAREF